LADDALIRQLDTLEAPPSVRSRWRRRTGASLERFLLELPQGDAPRTARLLEAQLLRLSSEPVDAARMVDWADQLQAPVASASDMLIRLHSVYGLPLPDKAQVDLELCARLNGLLERLFRRAFSERVSRPQLLLALHSVLGAQARTLCAAEQLCARPPENFWIDVHQTLALAAQERLLHVPLPSLSAPQPFSDVLNAYRRLLLLGALDLKSFARAEQVAIADAAWRWANDLEFLKPGIDASQRAVFSFNPERDAPPRPLNVMDPHPHSFTLEPLVDRLTSFSMRLPADGQVLSELPAYALKRIIRHLGQAQSAARALRNPSGGSVLGWIGLTAIQRALIDRAGRGAAKLKGDVAKVASFTLGESVAQRLDGAIDFTRARRAAQNRTDTVTVEPRPAREIPPLSWQVLDRSDEGFKLRCQAHGAVLKVGDLLGVVEDNEPFKLGLVRWLAQARDGAAIVGAQILALDPTPARVVVSDQRLPALKLHAVESAELPMSVIVPAQRVREGERALLDEGTAKRWIVLERVLEASPAMLRMRYRAPDPSESLG
jgi:hypothetical protein